MNQQDDLGLDQIEEADQDMGSQLDWEEELEEKYGGLEEDDDLPRKSRDLGSGFSKQKQVIEESGYYQKKKKKKEFKFREKGRR